ncbi:hypothetical protein RJP21_00495 [Paenibacillus sp. VCA1]|uniref:hypothetical protein n=1 Tax=Paenibacillus sp. VCA1 TaxID=3039148 RepID=UPI00287292EC|nr:hypothetical protein [Paenibacillus sp. VCA1]MDR9852072.1 hypothetical protein [Paenibacillus sp. VCA1]
MNKEQNRAEQAEGLDRTTKINRSKGPEAEDTEFAEEPGSEFRSAFKNPVTGEERLY